MMIPRGLTPLPRAPPTSQPPVGLRSSAFAPPELVCAPTSPWPLRAVSDVLYGAAEQSVTQSPVMYEAQLGDMRELTLCFFFPFSAKACARVFYTAGSPQRRRELQPHGGVAILCCNHISSLPTSSSLRYALVWVLFSNLLADCHVF